MTRWIKVLLGLSIGLLILSYPACQLGKQKLNAEMAKHSADLVVLDPIFLWWVLPGISMFFSGALLGLVSIVFWIVERNRR